MPFIDSTHIARQATVVFVLWTSYDEGFSKAMHGWLHTDGLPSKTASPGFLVSQYIMNDRYGDRNPCTRKQPALPKRFQPLDGGTAVAAERHT